MTNAEPEENRPTVEEILEKTHADMGKTVCEMLARRSWEHFKALPGREGYADLPDNPTGPVTP